MRLNTLPALMSLLASCLVAGPASAAAATTEWSSAPCSSVALGPGDAISHLQRIFLLGEPQYTIQYKFFADDQCLLPMYSVVLKGAARTTGPSATVADAIEVTVAIERLLFTLDSPRGAQGALACADGKFEVGVQRDVSEHACLHFQPRASCGVDYELVRIKDGSLTPGFRNANMCQPSGRPVRPQSDGVRLIGNF